MTRSTYKGFGVAPGADAYIKGLGDRMNRFVSSSFALTASTPDGYGLKGSVPAIRAGSMSARQTVSSGEFTGNALAGGPMEGTASVCTITGDDNNASLVVSKSTTKPDLAVLDQDITKKLA